MSANPQNNSASYVSPTRSDTRKNGCYDHAPFEKTVIVQQGWSISRNDFGRLIRTAKMNIRKVDFKPGCQYSISTADPRCDGCKHNQQPK